MNEYIKLRIITDRSVILDAIRSINNLTEDTALTLFVINVDNQVIGTITDGDIRRGLLCDYSLECSVTKVMNKNFTSIFENKIDVEMLRNIKKRGLKMVPIVDKDMHLIDVVNLTGKRSFLPIDAVLMAGGKGERLRPMTLTTPKPLLKVGGKPIIDYNINNLLLHGVKNINVTINYLGEQLEEHFAEKIENVQIKCVREPRYLGTIGSIKFIENWDNDTILIMNSDLFTNVDLEDFFLHFKKHDADISIAAVPYSVSIPYGIFEIEGDRNIIGVREKPNFNYYANAGIYLIKRKILELIPDDTFFNATDLIDLMIGKKMNIIRFPLSGFWIDIGKPEDFKKVQDIVKHINTI